MTISSQRRTKPITRRNWSRVYHLIQLGHDLSPDRAPVVQTVLGGKDWSESPGAVPRPDFGLGPGGGGPTRTAFDQAPPPACDESSVRGEWIIDQLGAPERLGMTFDYSHYASGSLPSRSRRRSRSDAPLELRGGEGRGVKTVTKSVFALPGEGGAWDQAEVISALYDGGYRGDFCCEVSSQVWKSNPPTTRSRRRRRASKT